MSSVDNRIVEMQFDNKQFEKGISTTINSIDDLKKALNFTGAEKGIDNITSKFNGIGLDKVNTALDSVTSKFSIFGTVADQAIRRVTDSITGTLLTEVGKLANAFSGREGLLEGFKEYELKIKSIQTIAANTGALSNKTVQNLSEDEEKAAKDVIQGLYASGEARRQQLELAGYNYDRVQSRVNELMNNMSENGKKTTSTMKDIDEALDELNVYADKTIYNFAQMTDAIGKFTVSGIDLVTSTEAVKGIANLAAVSGAQNEQYNRALYNISQAMSTGKMQLVDWRSLENAGMGGEMFQKAIVETAKKSTDAATREIAASIESGKAAFRDTLKEGWLTNDVLIESLNKFTAFTEEMTEEERELERVRWEKMGYTREEIANIEELSRISYEAAQKVRTWSQLVDTLKEEIGSSYTSMWQNIIGDFNEATELWTGIHDVIENNFVKPMAEARDVKWSYFHDNGGRDAAIQGFANVGNSLLKLFHAISDAWHEVFPRDDGRRITAIAKAFAAFSEKLVMSDETAEKVKTSFQGLFSVLHIFYKLIEAITPYILKMVSIIAPKILDITSYVGSLLIKLDAFISENEIFKNMAKNILEILIKIIDTIKSIFDIDIFKNLSIKNIFDEIIYEAEDFVDVFPRIINSLKDKDTSGVENFGSKVKKILQFGFENILDIGKKIFNKIKPIFEKIFGLIKNIIKVIGNLISNTSEELNLGNLLLAIFGIGAFKSVSTFIDGITNTFKSFTGIFKGITDAFKGFTGMFKNITEILNSVKDVLAAYTLEIKTEALKNIALSILMISGSLIALTFVDYSKLQSSVTIISEVLAVLLLSIETISKMSPTIKSTILSISLISTISLSLLALLPTILLLGAFDNTAQKGIANMTKVLTLLLVSLFAITKLIKDIKITDIISITLALISLVAAIDLLLPAILVLSLIPEDKLNNGIGSLTKLFAILAGSIVLLTNLTKTIKISQIISISLAIDNMVIAINALIIPILVLSLIPYEKIKTSLEAIILLLISLIGTVFLLSKIDNIDKSLSIMKKVATSILILTASLMLLSTIDTKTLFKTIGALDTMIISLVGTLFLLSKINNVDRTVRNLSKIANTIVVLAVSLKILSSINSKKLIISTAAISALLLVLTGVSVITSKINMHGLESLMDSISRLGFTLIEFGAAAYLFSKSIDIISNVDFNNANYESFGKVLIDVFNGITEAIPYAAELIVTAVKEILKAIRELAPELIKTLLYLLSEVLSSVVDNLPTIIKSIIDIILIVLKEIKNNIYKIVTNVIDIVLNIILAVADRMSDIVKSVAELVLSIIEGVNDWLSNDANRHRLKDDIEMFIALIIITLGEFFIDLLKAGINLITAIAKGIAQGASIAISSIISAISGAKDAAANWVKERWEDIKEIGSYLLEGIAEGIKSALNKVKDAVTSTCGGILSAVKDFFDISSPSKVMAQIGVYLDEGLAIGISDESKLALNAMSKLSSNIISEANNINDEIDNPKITPVLNMDEFEYGSAFSDIRTDVNGLVTNRLSVQFPSLDENNDKVVNAIGLLQEEISELQDYISELTIQMDTGALVGSIVKPMDKALGGRVNMRKQGV